MLTAALVDRLIQRAVGQIRTAARAVVSTITVEGARVLLQLDGLAGETLRDTELVQHYGFASVPKAGCDVIVAFLERAPTAKVVVASHDRRFRLEGMAEGEVALFTDEGDSVYLKRGEILVRSQARVVVEAPDVRLGGPGASHPLVYGDTLQQLLQDLCNAVLTAKPLGNLGLPVPFASDPQLVAAISQILAQLQTIVSSTTKTE